MLKVRLFLAPLSSPSQVFAPEAKTFVSCCLEVSNLQRDLFVLPRTMKLDARGEETVRPQKTVIFGKVTR